MAKILECPNCGAALSPVGSTNVVECEYCERSVVVEPAPPPPPPKPVAQAARPAPARSPKRSGRPLLESKRNRIWLGVGVGVFMVLATLFAHFSQRWNKPPDAKGEELVRELELTASHKDVEAVFAGFVHPNSRPENVTLDFPNGKIRRIELLRELPGRPEISRVNIHLNQNVSPEELARLEEVAPSRVEPHGGTGRRVKRGDTVLDAMNTSITLWHQSSIHTRNDDSGPCMERARAFWALARWAMFDGPSLSPEQKSAINGPTLEAAAAFAPATTVENAAEKFQSTFDAGWCQSRVGVVCTVDVDHGFVDELKWGWRNGLRARIQEIRVGFRKHAEPDKRQRAVAGCLQPSLGEGEEAVIDYVKGTRTWTWKVGDKGDTVVLSGADLLLMTAQDVSLEHEPAWLARFPSVASALAGCRSP